MPTLIQLKSPALTDKILEVFTNACGQPLTENTRLSEIILPADALQPAIRKLDLAGAYIPAASLLNLGLRLRDVAQESEAHIVTLRPPPPSLWGRVRAVLATAGAMPADDIQLNHTLEQIGAGIDWIGFLNNDFESEGIRLFNSDYPKPPGSLTADEVFQVVATLLKQKVRP
jgi:hypothetical protein